MSTSKSNWPRRIACITAETTELAFALGAGDRVVGVSGYSVRPEEARQKPKVATFTSIRMDKIRELDPDLILGFSDLQKEIARELVAEGRNVFISNQRSLEDIGDMILATGRLIGCAEQGQRLYDEFSRELDRLAAECRGGWRPKVYFEEWDDPMISGIRWVSELIERFGGKDIFREKSFHCTAKNRVVTSGEVLAADPDILVASWCGKKVQFEKIRSREGWGKMEAVKHQRLHEIKSSDILAPGLSLLHGARQMAAILKPLQERAPGMVFH